MTSISIKGNLGPLQRAFVDFRAKQVPFAMSLALNNLAKGVAEQEKKAIVETFDSPTPFTQNAYRIEVATKSKPIARVAAKDIQAQYLVPYVAGGDRAYGNKKGMIVPRNVPVNQYGNVPKGTLQRFKGKPNVFIGSITFRKSGQTISGVWQRNGTKSGKQYKGGGEYGTRGNNQNMIGGVRTTLKLLLQFQDTTPVRKNLEFYARANAYLRKHAAKEFEAAMRRALSSSR